MLTKDAPLGSYLPDYVLQIGQFLLDLTSLKLHKLVAFFGDVKDSFSTKSESIMSATAFLSMPSASIRSLAVPGLAETPKDKRYSSLSLASNLELIEWTVA